MGRYLTDLAAAVRTSGLPVLEWEGWQSRGHAPMAAVRGIAVHHTATPAHLPGDYPSLRVVRDGRSDLPGPLSQLGMGRSGTVHVIAAGLSYHTGPWSWPGTSGNVDVIGVEGESPGVGTSPWTMEQLVAWPMLLASLCRWYDLPVTRVAGHKEAAIPLGRKVDPAGIDMRELRAATGRILAPPVPIDLEDPVYRLARLADSPNVYLGNGLVRRHIRSEQELADVRWQFAAQLPSAEVRVVQSLDWLGVDITKPTAP